MGASAPARRHGRRARSRRDGGLHHRPGDPALGDAIGALAGKHSAVLLANHGPVVSAQNLDAAIYATEELEETAKLFLLLQNLPKRSLDAAEIAELKSVFKLD